MSFILEINDGGSFQWKPGRYESRVLVRYWWGWFAIARLKVSAKEYAETAYYWEED